jgi:hypothetical protein
LRRFALRADNELALLAQSLQPFNRPIGNAGQFGHQPVAQSQVFATHKRSIKREY